MKNKTKKPKKSELQAGMVIRLKIGTLFGVVKTKDTFEAYSKNIVLGLDKFDENLVCAGLPDLDVVEIYNVGGCDLIWSIKDEK